MQYSVHFDHVPEMKLVFIVALLSCMRAQVSKKSKIILPGKMFRDFCLWTKVHSFKLKTQTI